MNWKDFWANPDDRPFQNRLKKLCAGRERLSEAEYYQRFYAEAVALGGRPVAKSTVSQVRNLFVLRLGDVFYLIYPDDDWSKEFRVLWDLDSLADVELVADMEEVFGITISEAEASAMTSLRKTVAIITAKLPPREDASA